MQTIGRAQLGLAEQIHDYLRSTILFLITQDVWSHLIKLLFTGVFIVKLLNFQNLPRAVKIFLILNLDKFAW